MKGIEDKVCVGEQRIADVVVRLKEDFAEEFGRDVPTEIISRTVKEWLKRYFDQLSDDLYDPAQRRGP